MNTRQFLPLTIILLLLFMFVQCGENIFETKEKVTPPNAELLKPVGKGEGKPDGAGDNDNQRGGDFGDLYLIVRDEDGAPIYIPIQVEGEEIQVVQAIAFNVLYWTEEGEAILEENDSGFPVEAADPGDGDYILGYNEEGDLDVEEGDPVAPANVEFGRKSLARSPQRVLNKALEEALKVLKADDALSIDYCGRLVGMLDGENKTIDSPRENMALYQAIMKEIGGFGEGDLDDILDKLDALAAAPYNVTLWDIAASCFAAASDKTDALTIDEIVFTNTFLGLNLKDNDGNVVEYFDYSEYSYSRDRYDYRFIAVRTFPEPNQYLDVCGPISDFEENGDFEYTDDWPGWSYGMWDNIEGFRTAADDAIQVLEFIHGDDDIVFEGFEACP